jgi:hypothetical protein
MVRTFAFLIALLYFTITSSAQTTATATADAEPPETVVAFSWKDSSKEDRTYVSIGTGGVKVGNNTEVFQHSEKRAALHFLMFDLGINALNDRTDYSGPAAQQYLQMDGDRKNTNLYSLRQLKSINVNLWPILLKLKLQGSKNQKISLYTGAGLQFYNFRFNKNISHLNETTPQVIHDSVQFSKNKLAFSYLSVPLMFNFKTRMGGDIWLNYGLGLIGGYRIDSWTKQISDERGKVKNHDPFDFQQFNLNLSGEIGVNDYIHLYGTYQISNLYSNSLAQHPYCIGIRFFGI